MQTVFHLHVVPRHHGDKLSFAKARGPSRPEPDETAALIRRALAD